MTATPKSVVNNRPHYAWIVLVSAGFVCLAAAGLVLLIGRAPDRNVVAIATKT